MARKLAFLLFFLLKHTKWSLAFARARRLGRKINRVPRVLRLFGQRVGARRDSGEFEKI